MGELKFVPDDYSVKKKYEEAGRVFAETVDHYNFGWMTDDMLMEKHSEWERWEKEYAGRGFRTLGFGDFERAFNRSLHRLLDQKRKEGEEPAYHAAAYRQILEKMVAEAKQKA